jgi:hypothetical protein
MENLNDDSQSESKMATLMRIIRETAKQECCWDEDGYEIGSSYNHGDTFTDGSQSGRVEFARDLLKILE